MADVTESSRRKKKGPNWKRWSGEGWRRSGDAPLDESGKPRRWGGGGGAGRGGSTFQEVEDKEAERTRVNKFIAERRGRGSKEEFQTDKIGTPVRLPRGSFSALSNEDKAKLVTAEEFYGGIAKVPPNQVGQYFTREDMEAMRTSESHLTEEEIKDKDLEFGEFRGEPGLTEEEIIRQEEIAAEEERIGERGLGERLFEVDPRIGPQISETLFSTAGGGSALGRGANIFGKTKTAAEEFADLTKALTTKTQSIDEIFANIKAGKSTRNNVVGGDPNKIIPANTNVQGTGVGAIKPNPKTVGLSERWLQKIGLSNRAAIALVGAFSTYPWATHNKREAVDTLTFAMKRSIDEDDIESWREQRALYEELINPGLWEIIWKNIPGVNVIATSVDGMKASAKSTTGLDESARKKGWTL